MVRRAFEILIVFVIGLVIGPLLPMSLGAPQSTTSIDRANLATATSFYAAANRFLEVGDDAPLLELLDSSFVDHSLLGLEPTTGGLLRYLASLRAAYPEIRLEATALATQQDVVTVSLATTQSSTAIAGGPIPDWDPSVPGVEQLRIRDGKVVERWASGSPATAGRAGRGGRRAPASRLVRETRDGTNRARTWRIHESTRCGAIVVDRERGNPFARSRSGRRSGTAGGHGTRHDGGFAATAWRGQSSSGAKAW